MGFPASGNTSTLPQATVTYWDKIFRENLKQQTAFVALCERLDQPMHSGINREIFMYEPLAGNSSFASEGIVTAPIAPPTLLSTSFTIGTLSDNVTFSSLSIAAALDDVVKNIGKEMNYRVGQSLSSLVRTSLDAGTSVDSNVQVKLSASSTTNFTALALNNIRNAVQSLAGRGVRPFDDKSQCMCGVISPFALGDVLQAGVTGSTNTSLNNNPIDIFKYMGTPEGIAKMDELVSTDLTQVIELPTTGCKFFQSNLVTTTANFQSVSGLTALRTYIVGRDAVFAVTLRGPSDTEFGDGQYQSVSANIEQNAAPSAYDPGGLIPGWASYRINFTAGLGPDTVGRYRYIDAASAIS